MTIQEQGNLAMIANLGLIDKFALIGQNYHLCDFVLTWLLRSVVRWIRV